MRLCDEFEALLGGAEEPVHQFLKAQPDLFFPGYSAIWSKAAIGDHVSDFSARRTQRLCPLEIQAPYKELFRRDGQQPEMLTRPISQIRTGSLLPITGRI